MRGLSKIIQSYTDLAQADQEALADNFSQYDFEIQDVFLEALPMRKDLRINQEYRFAKK